MINPLCLDNRVFVVTGASSGIGLATSILLSGLGAKLVLIARNKERLSAAMSQLHGTGHRAQYLDLSVPDDLPQFLRNLSAEVGLLNGVVHCAGTQALRPLRMVNSQDIAGVVNLNINASLMLAKGVRQKGVRALSVSIVFVSSVMGLVGAPGRSVYCAGKGALNSMTKALALELAAEGIRVNCVAPGFVKTPMLQEASLAIGDDQLRRVEAMHPLGFGDPLDVANAIAFLLADTGRWITGTTLVVDGGYTAH